MTVTDTTFFQSGVLSSYNLENLSSVVSKQTLRYVLPSLLYHESVIDLCTKVVKCYWTLELVEEGSDDRSRALSVIPLAIRQSPIQHSSNQVF